MNPIEEIYYLSRDDLTKLDMCEEITIMTKDFKVVRICLYDEDGPEERSQQVETDDFLNRLFVDATPSGEESSLIAEKQYEVRK